MTGFKMIAGGYAASGFTALLGQIDPTSFGSWLQYGALGILGGTTLGLFYVIIKLVDGYNRLADSAEKRDVARATKDDQLIEAITKLRENCAAANAKK